MLEMCVVIETGAPTDKGPNNQISVLEALPMVSIQNSPFIVYTSVPRHSTRHSLASTWGNSLHYQTLNHKTGIALLL